MRTYRAATSVKSNVSSARLVPLLVRLVRVVHVVPSGEVCTSNVLVRTSPSKNAIFTKLTVFDDPRSRRIHWPSPCADQRVARLPSTAFAGTLPSSVLAVTDVPGTVNFAGEAAPLIETGQ